MNAAEKGICKECIELHLVVEEVVRRVCQLPESLHLLTILDAERILQRVVYQQV